MGHMMRQCWVQAKSDRINLRALIQGTGEVGEGFHFATRQIRRVSDREKWSETLRLPQ